MHRTEGANNLAGLFTEGPPATTVTEEWLNAVQEEIANVIEGAGITLKTAAGDTRDQLRTAILGTVPMPRGYIDGLVMSNDTDTAHDISIAVGKCRDAGDTESILFAAAMVKQIDAAWAVGTGAGGFPTGLGAVGNDTWYHVFVIMKADGTVDAGFDTSLIATNLLADATDFLYYRRVGSVLTDGSANIYQFIQIGDWFIWDTPQQDYQNNSPGVNSVTITVRSPLGVSTKIWLNWNSNSAGYVYWRHPSIADIAPVGNTVPYAGYMAANQHKSNMKVHTNTSSQICFRFSVNGQIFVSLIGYEDPRGKDL